MKAKAKSVPKLKITLQPCFMHGITMYVPHVKNPKEWVTYGGVKIKTLQELQLMGAKVRHEMMYAQNPETDWISHVYL
jgi:hypothetical protein